MDKSWIIYLYYGEREENKKYKFFFQEIFFFGRKFIDNILHEIIKK
jgi:hypothetical protein